MVPEIRPSGYTSILAPTRCGVEPCAATMVTSATSSPRSSAFTSSVRTSWLIGLSYRTGRLKPAPQSYVGTAFRRPSKIIRSPIKDLVRPRRDPNSRNRPQHEDVARRDAVDEAYLGRRRQRGRPPGANQRDRTRGLSCEQHLQDG